MEDMENTMLKMAQQPLLFKQSPSLPAEAPAPSPDELRRLRDNLNALDSRLSTRMNIVESALKSEQEISLKALQAIME